MRAALPWPVREFEEAEELLYYEAERQGIRKDIMPRKDEFIQYTRHHPFLISRVVAMAKEKGIEMTLNNLRSLRGEVEEAVAGFIGKMVEPLDDEARGLLKRLVIFAGGFDYSAIESICGIEGLEQLTDSSIIDYEIAVDRYSLHQLVLDYIKKRLPLPPEEEEKIRLKGARHYLKVAQGSSDPWPEIEQDEANIRQAADWTAEGIEKEDRDREIIGLAYDYAFALKDYIYRRSIQEGLKWLEVGVVACLARDKRKEVGVLYNSIGGLYHIQGSHNEALEWYQKSVEIVKEFDDLSGLAAIYNNIGGIYFDQGNYSEAIKWLEKSLKIKEEAESLSDLVIAYNNIGMVYHKQGNYSKALNRLDDSLKLAKKINDLTGIATAYNNIGQIHKAQGSYKEALNYYEKSKEINDRMGNLQSLVKIYNNIGWIHYIQGNVEKALSFAKEGLKIAEDIGNPSLLADGYNSIACVYYSQGSYHNAIKWAKKSIEIFEKIGRMHKLADVLKNIGFSYQKINKSKETKTCFKKSYNLYTQLNLPDEAEKVKQLIKTL